MKLLLASALLLIGTSAFALDSTAKAIGDELAITNVHECMVEAWTATNPTEDQSHQAKVMMDTLHADLVAADSNIQTLKRNILAAWVRHPIDINEVNQTTSALQNVVDPLRSEITTTTVNVINLLTVAQRGTFDHAFFTCIHK